MLCIARLVISRLCSLPSCLTAARTKSPSGELHLVQHSRKKLVSRREHIVEAVRNHQIILLAGETGCGKTTQVPQYILEDSWGELVMLCAADHLCYCAPHPSCHLSCCTIVLSRWGYYLYYSHLFLSLLGSSQKAKLDVHFRMTCCSRSHSAHIIVFTNRKRCGQWRSLQQQVVCHFVVPADVGNGHYCAMLSFVYRAQIVIS